MDSIAPSLLEPSIYIREIIDLLGETPKYSCHMLSISGLPLKEFGKHGYDKIFFTGNYRSGSKSEIHKRSDAIQSAYEENLPRLRNMFGLRFNQFNNGLLFIECDLFIPCDRTDEIVIVDRDRREGLVYRGNVIDRESIANFESAISSAKDLDNIAYTQVDNKRLRGFVGTVKFFYAELFGYSYDNTHALRKINSRPETTLLQQSVNSKAETKQH